MLKRNPQQQQIQCVSTTQQYILVPHCSHLYPRFLATVNILGSPKNAHLCLMYIKYGSSNWPDDDSISRNMSPHL